VSITDFGYSRVLDSSGFNPKMASGISPCMSSELIKVSEGEGFNPITAQGWRWKAPELMEVPLNEEEESIPGLTEATDVWAFGMTIVEVYSFLFCSPFLSR